MADSGQRRASAPAQEDKLRVDATERKTEAAAEGATTAFAYADGRDNVDAAALQTLVRPDRPPAADGALRPGTLLHLQTEAGNAAVNALLSRRPGLDGIGNGIGNGNGVARTRRPVAVRPRLLPNRQRIVVARKAIPAPRSGATAARQGAGAAAGAATALAGTTEADTVVEGVEEDTTTPQKLIGADGHAAGTAAVQRKAGGGNLPPPPMPPVAKKAQDDPRFAKVASKARKTAKKVKAHPSGKSEAKKAQKAAKAPPDDKLAQAKAKSADTMATAKPGPFNEEAFVAAVETAVKKAAPQNLDEAEKFDKSGKAEGVKTAVAGKVSEGKDAAAGDVKQKTDKPPDPSQAVEKPAEPMAPTKVEQPAALKAADALPPPAPKEQTDFRRGPAEVDQKMASEGVSEEQLKKSNEPAFTGALEAKKVGEDHAKKAPAEVRKAEGQVLKQAAGAATSAEATSLGAIRSMAKKVASKVASKKGSAKEADEAERQKVTNEVNRIYNATKTEVDAILNGLGDKVDKQFADGESQVRQQFTSGWKRDLDKYKDDRYSGLEGAWNWTRDLFKGLPQEVNVIYKRHQDLYMANMRNVIRGVARTVTGELNAAKARIERGRAELKKYVDGLSPKLKKVGEAAANEMASQFDQLDSSVDDKMGELVDSIAQKYAESQKAVQSEIAAAQAENRGLIDKAKDMVGEVVNTIKGLRDMLLNVLRRAADAIDRIIKDPIGFLGRLVEGIKTGVQRFAGNILEHLKKGLLGWLFGALGSAGIEMPKTFDLKGILQLVMSVLGLTWQHVRSRLVKFIGEKGVSAIETGADIIKKIVVDGPAALWTFILEKLTDFKEMVIGQIRDFVVEKIVKAGIVWIISLLNPAAAFIKACKAIYDIVMFFVERGSQIKELIDAVIDGIVDVAKGNIGGIASKIEDALAKALPVAIGLLASLLGLGGISEKIRSIIDKVRAPVTKALDFAIGGIVKLTKPIWSLAKKGFGKAKDFVKAKAKAAKDWAKAKVEKGKAWVKKKVSGAKEAITGLFKKQQKPLTMKGAAHTLIANPTADGKSFKISMKSTEGLLSTKVKVAVESLKERQQTEDADARAKTQKQIDQLVYIAKVAADLEAKAAKAGLAQVGPTGAPPGFESEMGALAGIIEKYSAETGENDIKKAEPGTQVNLELLAKFGLPVASYLQAQEVADGQAAVIDIRASNVEAPKLLAEGALPKSEKVKTKTVNDEDVALGVPAAHKGKAAWFLPHPLPAERPASKSEGDWEKIKGRWAERRQEYFDFIKDIGKKMSDGQLMLLHGTTSEVRSGGVLLDGLKDVAYTGDHDVYRVSPESKEPSVISALKPAPFRVQHGAHVSWPNLPEVLKKGGLSPEEKNIYDSIVKKHARGGEALLRVNPKAPPTTASSEALGDVPEGGGGGAGGPGAAGAAAAGPNQVVDVPKPDFAGGDGKALELKETKSFEANGESHTITTTVKDGKVDVVVASDNPKELQTLIADLEKAKAPERSDALELLKGAVARKADLAKIAATYDTAAAKEKIDAQIKEAMSRIHEVEGDVQRAMALLVKGGDVLPADMKGKVRTKLYTFDTALWDSAREQCFQEELPGVRQQVQAFLSTKPVNASEEERKEIAKELRAMERNGEPIVDTWLAAKYVKNGQLTDDDFRSAVHWQVDHKVPLATHWQTVGNNTSDEERQAHAVARGNLQLISRYENLSAGSSYKTPGAVDDKHRYKYKLEVGKNFTTNNLDDDKWKKPRS
jgi:hypothetical protein